MTIHFKCECLKEFHLSDEHANKLARCKNCQRIFRVPKPVQSDELQKITTISGPNIKLVMFKCDECGKKYAVKQEAAGKKVKCKKCNKLIEIPHEGIKDIVASAETKDIEKKQDKKHNPLILYLLMTILTIILLVTITYGYFYFFKNNDIKEEKVVSLDKDLKKSDISEEKEEDILDEKQLTEGLEKINALKQSSQEQIIKKEEIKELITQEEKTDKIDKSKSNIIDSAESPEKKIEEKKALTIQPEKEIDVKKDLTIKSEIDKKEKIIKPDKELEEKKNKPEKEAQKEEIQNISIIKPDVIEIKAAEKLKKEPKKYLKKQKNEIIIAKKDTSINLKGIINLRSKPKYLLDKEVRSVVEKYNFFDVRRNRGGYFANNFVDNRNGTITDRKTGLMWQKSGSSEMMPYNDANNYITELNKKQFGGFNDWRLPTLEELLTLTEQQTTRQGTYIAPIFSQKQGICVSSDTCKYENTFIPWYASFLRGVVNCTTYNVLVNYYVRAVRNHSTIN